MFLRTALYSCSLSMLLMLNVTVFATDMTVFGLTIGQKFEVAECEKISPKLPDVYKYNDTSMCFERFADYKGTQRVLSTVPIANSGVLLKFPMKEWPEIAAYDGITATIIDGNLEGVKMTTYGIGSVDKVLASLTEKYGKPTAKVTEKVQNRLGAIYDYPNAIWKLDNLTVTFIGVTNDLDEGLVRIESNKAREKREKWEAEQNNQKRKL